MRRVLAAVEAHMWSGLHMKPQPSVRGDCGSGSGGSSAITDAAGHLSHSAGYLPAGSHQPATPPTSDAADGAEGCSRSVDGDADLCAAEVGASAGARQAFGSFVGAEEVPDPDDDADRSFAQLMGQMSGLLLLHTTCACGSAAACSELQCMLGHLPAGLVPFLVDTANDPCGQIVNEESVWQPRCEIAMLHDTGVRERLRDLPDSERRAGAEQMALQMMQLLGIDDSDDGTEDSADAAPPQDGQQWQQQQQQSSS
jgi:hypothetical protein